MGSGRRGRRAASACSPGGMAAHTRGFGRAARRRGWACSAPLPTPPPCLPATLRRAPCSGRWGRMRVQRWSSRGRRLVRPRRQMRRWTRPQPTPSCATATRWCQVSRLPCALWLLPHCSPSICSMCGLCSPHRELNLVVCCSNPNPRCRGPPRICRRCRRHRRRPRGPAWRRRGCVCVPVRGRQADARGGAEHPGPGAHLWPRQGAAGLGWARRLAG
jgi:hypothetical protein